METQEIANLKMLLKQQGGENCLDTVTHGITEDGFLFLMQLFVMKEHTETVWMALRHFHYSDDLQMPITMMSFDLKAGQSVEFTTEARLFLTTVWIVILWREMKERKKE